MKPIIITAAVYEAIKKQIGQSPVESGGLLAGDIKQCVVTHFHFDDKGTRSAVSYSPNTATLTKLLQRWNKENVFMLGFVHSHPRGLCQPSGGDEEYARAILDANPELPTLLIPIVQSSADGGNFSMRMFAAERKKDGVKIQSLQFQIQDKTKIVTEFDFELFSRVRAAYDMERLASSRVIWIGVGSGAAGCEDLARAGVGEFVLIDPGIVETCNLATQHYYKRDIDRPKVECLARRLRNVNPKVRVVTRQRRLQDIDDRTFKKLASDPIPKLFRLGGQVPEMTVIVGGTDDFHAQARVNLLSLHFGLPSVSCQTYRGALGGEVSFLDQRTTKACHRCILSARYSAYLEKGFKNDVGSSGSPITSTPRFNALTTTIVLAILHHQTQHPIWGSLLERMGNRNLALVRCHPDVDKLLGLDHFTEAFAENTTGQIFFDETIWRRQEPEHPDTGYARPCPDCLGTGNLFSRKGAFADTREITP